MVSEERSFSQSIQHLKKVKEEEFEVLRKNKFKVMYEIEKDLALQGQIIVLPKIFPSHVNQHCGKLSCETI